MSEIVLKVDAETYEALKILAENDGFSVEELVKIVAETLIDYRRDEIEKAAENKKFNQFTEDI